MACAAAGLTSAASWRSRSMGISSESEHYWKIVIDLIIPHVLHSKSHYSKSEVLSMLYGYARVSTSKQDHTSQVEQLKAAGCEKVFTEKASGAKTDRDALRKAIARLEEGDTLVVTRLDRLARSTRDLLNILDEISQRGASFKSLADTWADTTTAQGRLMLTILGGLAEFERTLIQSRTEAGIQKAREQGKKFGRPSALDAGQKRKIADRYAKGETMAELAREYEVGEATIHRALKAA
jgi:DNA invertase Pin-like site-specific DNA recombinase